MFLRIVYNRTGHGGNQDDGARLVGSDHGFTNSLGNEEGAGQVDIDESAEHDGVIGLGRDVGARSLSAFVPNVEALNESVADSRCKAES